MKTQKETDWINLQLKTLFLPSSLFSLLASFFNMLIFSFKIPSNFCKIAIEIVWDLSTNLCPLLGILEVDGRKSSSSVFSSSSFLVCSNVFLSNVSGSLPTPLTESLMEESSSYEYADLSPDEISKPIPKYLFL